MPEGIPFQNDNMDRPHLREVVAVCYRELGGEATAEIVDKIKNTGFHYATRSGITIAIHEIQVPKNKPALLKEADAKVEELVEQFQMGLITEEERYEGTVKIWSETTKDIENAIKERMPEYGSLNYMASSGTKGNITQIRHEFLRNAGKFKEIGARIPKGVLLVGPPGTGKTLIARAVAGEAGVPFISVTGSDFMEMFVGVGAARVRDLFQTARKQAPAIIFVDEIDSIGRKRGAGLGGGHDEREQTLNQMLSEMDGFETTEGIVMMGATNRPDGTRPSCGPAASTARSWCPSPTQTERHAILEVHCKDKRIGPDVDLDVMARGTPGMSGADLANLVNEAALFAVRRGADKVAACDFDDARDRVLMGQRRESMALSDEEKEVIAYHEGGHAVLAYVLPNADPVHKVTILPTGMALGVTQQLPLEERHIYRQDYIEDSLVVRLGGRLAEEAVYEQLSTGANNDLVGCTELARKMVREWGMSSRIGPMAWGSQGAVFLGEDLMHTRDYSDDTARVIDEEVERILREQEERAGRAAPAPPGPRRGGRRPARARDDRRRRGRPPRRRGRRPAGGWFPQGPPGRGGDAEEQAGRAVGARGLRGGGGTERRGRPRRPAPGSPGPRPAESG